MTQPGGWGVFNATTVFGAAMVGAGGGSIVNIGSLYASVAPEPRFYDHLPGFVKPAGYAASKAGVLQLTRYFARLWGPAGVRVNALSPGGVRAEQDPEFLAKYCARVPLGPRGWSGLALRPCVHRTCWRSRDQRCRP